MVKFNINNDLRFDCASKSRLFVCENSVFFFTADGGFYNGNKYAIESQRKIKTTTKKSKKKKNETKTNRK